MTAETITWISVADQLPDDDATVLIYAPADGSEAVKCGYRYGLDWLEFGSAYYTDDRMVLAEVTHWAAWPGGPE